MPIAAQRTFVTARSCHRRLAGSAAADAWKRVHLCQSAEIFCCSSCNQTTRTIPVETCVQRVNLRVVLSRSFLSQLTPSSKASTSWTPPLWRTCRSRFRMIRRKCRPCLARLVLKMAKQSIIRPCSEHCKIPPSWMPSSQEQKRTLTSRPYSVRTRTRRSTCVTRCNLWCLPMRCSAVGSSTSRRLCQRLT